MVQFIFGFKFKGSFLLGMSINLRYFLDSLELFYLIDIYLLGHYLLNPICKI
jgi:hypothetical protein